MKFHASHTLALALTFSLISASPAWSSGGHSSDGPSPRQVLKSLKDGNARFVDGEPHRPHQGHPRRKELANGQKPGAIVLSCSDSRVPPELIFDQGLGDVFTVRVAGNVLGAATVASIEYAVEHLGSSLIVVMGHESCGAVKAALTTPRGKSAGSADIDALISAIQPAVETSSGRMPASASIDKLLRKPVMQNVDAVAHRLLTRSKIVRNAVDEGRVQIVRAIYGLASGKVDFWGLTGEGVPHAPSRKLASSHEAKDAGHGEDHGHGKPHGEEHGHAKADGHGAKKPASKGQAAHPAAPAAADHGHGHGHDEAHGHAPAASHGAEKAHGHGHDDDHGHSH